MPAGDIRSTDAVEIKWGIHPPGDKRADWTADHHRDELGDYVVWGPGIDHAWYATDHSVVITVRWPSRSS